MPRGLFYGFSAFSGELRDSSLCWSQVDNDLASLVSTIEGIKGGIDFIAIDILTSACVAIGTDAMWETRLQAFTRRWIADLTRIAVPPLPIPVRFLLFLLVYCMYIVSAADLSLLQ